MHWTEMAALCPGVQYGLSSQKNFGENKDLIFVKLTDSALRAIEDYLKNQNKLSFQNPTIKFLGNEGQLSFPSLHNGNTSFNFSMSSTADMEGPGGSFECVQQSGPPRGSLEILGSIPYKIRVHANDDVYEATRHRMTIAEENHKNKCTREIKLNQKDIGRKVKLQQNRSSLVPIRKEISSSHRDNVSKSNYQSVVSKPTAVHSSNNGVSNGLSSNHVSSSRPQLNKPSVPDVTRRPIKERLIHLLALRPFKKVELHERLKEGTREKFGMTSVLKQIAYMKDNCYHLNRAMWNEVNEDWPFYTESERQMLKRRKPQNLTPPGSDGCSSGSGQSPTSTHPGSPPSITSTSSSSKRPGYYDGHDGLPTKRQRISHYKKPSEQNYRSPILENNSQRKPITDSRDASNMNPRSRELPNGCTFNNGYNNNGSMLNEKRNNYSDDIVNKKQRSCDSHNSLYIGVNREKTFIIDSSKYSPQSNNKITDDIRKDNNNDKNIGINNEIVPNGKYKNLNNMERSRLFDKNEVTSTNQNNCELRISPDSQSDHMSVVSHTDNPPLSPLKIDNGSDFPDYLTQYTTIKNVEQRRKYKADFNADYAEYKDLHGIVEKVSSRFAELEGRLKQEDPSSIKYQDIKNQIVREYQENKKDVEHQKAKQRFQYLHEKLSHIKRLVLEYDQGVADSQY